MFKYCKSFRQRDDGVAAIEFAFFAVPFFLLIMGIIEIGLMTAASTVLNGATEDAARAVRTGQVFEAGFQPAGTTCTGAQACFEDQLCDKASIFFDCDGFRYNVVRLDPSDEFEDAVNDPSSVGLPPVEDPADSTQLSASSFNAGVPNDRIIVRVSYDYPLFTPLAGPIFSDRPNNRRLLISTAIIQNEPY